MIPRLSLGLLIELLKDVKSLKLDVKYLVANCNNSSENQLQNIKNMEPFSQINTVEDLFKFNKDLEDKPETFKNAVSIKTTN